jgi:Peptidase family M50.
MFRFFGERFEIGEGRYTELIHILIAWLVLTFVFSFRFILNELFSAKALDIKLLSILIYFGIFGIITATGFVLHELAHKYTARYYGHFAEFRMSQQGLALAIFITVATFGNFIFAAPGATVIVPRGSIFGFGLTRKENGIIAALGPITNLILAKFFFILTLAFSSNPLISFIGSLGVFVNLWLAAFNLIPIGVLDGAKVLNWNILVWALLTIPSWVLVIIIIIS